MNTAYEAVTIPMPQPSLGTFERYLTVWVFLCIIIGVALGHWFPRPFEVLGQLKVAEVNLAVAVLIWLMMGFSNIRVLKPDQLPAFVSFTREKPTGPR